MPKTIPMRRSKQGCPVSRVNNPANQLIRDRALRFFTADPEETMPWLSRLGMDYTGNDHQ
jgi:hypothetical protein